MDANSGSPCAADTVRYHIHSVKEGCGLPDGVQYLPGFKTGFLQPQSTSLDDFDPLMGAVCGEPPAVEEASDEAFAPPGRSDEPGPESLSAVTQQVDRFIRTEQAAFSFKRKCNSQKSVHSFS